VRVIDAEVYPRVRFCFKHVMLPLNFNSLLVVFASTFKVLQLPVKPANAVGHTWIPKEIAIAARLIDCLVERCQRCRHSAQIPPRQAEKEERREQQKPIA